MQFLKRALMAIGTLALVASLLTLVAPKSVHALVTTLVTVMNTAAAPAITQDTSRQASQIVTLRCATSISSTKLGCVQQLATGALGLTQYKVPPTQSLVITGLDFTAGDTPVSQLPKGVSIYLSVLELTPIFWYATLNDPVYWQQYTFSPGIVVGSGLSPVVSIDESLFFEAALHGYLTTN